MIQLDIKPGDTILVGKFKNKKVVVKSITKDEYGNPLINNQPIMKIRVPKWYQQTENKMKKSELRNIIREELKTLNEGDVDRETIFVIWQNITNLIDKGDIEGLKKAFDSMFKTAKSNPNQMKYIKNIANDIRRKILK